MKKLRVLAVSLLTTAFLGASALPVAAQTVTYTVPLSQYYTFLRPTTYTTTSTVKVKIPTTTTTPSTPVTTPTAPTTSTPASTSLTAPLTAQEQQMVNLVNQERTSRGLAPLQVDMRLVKIARMKSIDMIQNHYFSHVSPTYGLPFDMMKAAGVTYQHAGENLAGAGTVDRAHTLLMNSPGHRANILDAGFTKIGIGVVQGGPYGLMISQEFIR